MNGTFVFIICVIAVAGFFKVVHAYIDKQDAKGSRDPEIDEALEKIERLEERIQVLERIVTEKQFDLKKEIDRL